VKLYDIGKSKADCIMTLRHDHHVGTVSISPDNQLLAVGG